MVWPVGYKRMRQRVLGHNEVYWGKLPITRWRMMNRRFDTIEQASRLKVTTERRKKNIKTEAQSYTFLEKVDRFMIYNALLFYSLKHSGSITSIMSGVNDLGWDPLAFHQEWLGSRNQVETNFSCVPFLFKCNFKIWCGWMFWMQIIHLSDTWYCT